jgi:hypothetical protein
MLGEEAEILGSELKRLTIAGLVRRGRVGGGLFDRH